MARFKVMRTSRSSNATGMFFSLAAFTAASISSPGLTPTWSPSCRWMFANKMFNKNK